MDYYSDQVAAQNHIWTNKIIPHNWVATWRCYWKMTSYECGTWGKIHEIQMPEM